MNERKTATMQCNKCGKSFVTDDMRVQHCPTCMELPNRMRYSKHFESATKACKFCGKEFMRNRSTAKYCSPKCFYAAQRKRSAVEKACRRCGKIFFGPRIIMYCSYACRWAKINRTCKTCGNVFMGNATALYCSKKCKPLQYTRKTNNRTCKTCGVAFMATATQLYCHMAGCVSATFRGTKIGVTYKVDGIVDKRKACATVICSKVDEVGAALFRTFSTINIEPYLSAFKQVKNRFLAASMGNHVHRVGAAAAIFYVVSRKAVSQVNIMRVISNELRLNVTESTLRKYMKRIVADVETRKILAALPEPTIKVKHDDDDSK